MVAAVTRPSGRLRIERTLPAERLPVGVLLEFERTHPGGSGRKAEAVRHRFGLSLPSWYQQLTAALATREALEHDAVFVRHLQDRLDRAVQRRLELLSRPPPN